MDFGPPGASVFFGRERTSPVGSAPTSPDAASPELTLDVSRYPGIQRIPWWALSSVAHIAFVVGFWFVTAGPARHEGTRRYTVNLGPQSPDLDIEILSDVLPIEDPTILDADDPFELGYDGTLRGEVNADAIVRGLDWLARHQSPNGAWSCDGFGLQCRDNACGGAGSTSDYTPGTTALATLAFLGAGHTLRYGQYKGIVKKAVQYLVSIQTADGCIGPKVADGRYMYNHTIGTLALAEAYSMSRSPALKRLAQKAVDFLMAAQNPYGGWRYGVRPGDADTSMTAWAVLAMTSATLAELQVPARGFAGAKNWLDKATDDSFYKTGYTQKGDSGRFPCPNYRWRYQPTESMTAAALASRLFMGARPDDVVIRGGARLVKNQPPEWEPDYGNDYYYWYFGTLAMFQIGGVNWQVWKRRLLKAVALTQERDGDQRGSWSPKSAWGDAGGLVYATAINTMTLEVCNRHRHPKVLGSSQRKK